MKRIAILGSGNGTNAQRIIEYFAESKEIEVACVIYNRKEAYIAQRATNLGIESRYFGKKAFTESNEVLEYLREKKADYVILAGFLLLIPENILKAYPQKVINIHPALLPKYGGKGMYGEHVHEAVVANHEKETGITVHVVDQDYDKGTTLLQARVQLTEDDTAESVADKIHWLEQAYFAVAIEEYIRRDIRR